MTPTPDRRSQLDPSGSTGTSACDGGVAGQESPDSANRRTSSFYYSFLVLPRRQRQAIVAVWEFCRAVDDAVDEAPAWTGIPSARDGVIFWRAELDRCYAGLPPTTSQGRALQPMIKPFDLPRDAFEDVIDGVAMDLDVTRYESFEDLIEYCRRVASAVGMICIRVFGCRTEGSREYALNLGIALQLTNILRDIKEDFARGRVYLPLRDLEACGCAVEELGALRTPDPLRRLVEFECDRARQYYQRATRALPAEDRRRLVAAEIMRRLYFETLLKIERNGYDVLGPRLRVGRPRQLLIALAEWLTVQSHGLLMR
jgi:15-cis-phytoene synthase